MTHTVAAFELLHASSVELGHDASIAYQVAARSGVAAYTSTLFILCESVSMFPGPQPGWETSSG